MRGALCLKLTYRSLFLLFLSGHRPIGLNNPPVTVAMLIHFGAVPLGRFSDVVSMLDLLCCYLKSSPTHSQGKNRSFLLPCSIPSVDREALSLNFVRIVIEEVHHHPVIDFTNSIARQVAGHHEDHGKMYPRIDVLTVDILLQQLIVLSSLHGQLQVVPFESRKKR